MFKEQLNFELKSKHPGLEDFITQILCLLTRSAVFMWETEETHVPIANTKISCWKAVLPAVLVIFSVENLLLVLLRGDVALPLLLTVAVLPTHPAVEVHLECTEDTHPVSGCCLCGPTGHLCSGTRTTRNDSTQDPDSTLGEPVQWGMLGENVKLKVKSRTKERAASTQEAESRGDGPGQGSRQALARSWCANKGVCRQDKGPGSNKDSGEDSYHKGKQRGCENLGLAHCRRTSNSILAHELSPYYGPGLVPGAREVHVLGRHLPGGTDPHIRNPVLPHMQACSVSVVLTISQMPCNTG